VERKSQKEGGRDGGGYASVTKKGGRGEHRLSRRINSQKGLNQHLLEQKNVQKKEIVEEVKKFENQKITTGSKNDVHQE